MNNICLRLFDFATSNRKNKNMNAWKNEHPNPSGWNQRLINWSRHNTVREIPFPTRKVMTLFRRTKNKNIDSLWWIQVGSSIINNGIINQRFMNKDISSNDPRHELVIESCWWIIILYKSLHQFFQTHSKLPLNFLILAHMDEQYDSSSGQV